MTDNGIFESLVPLLHELAEALQSTGAYLGAAQRISTYDPAMPDTMSDMIERAAAELSRGQTALHHVRDHLSGIAADSEAAAPERNPRRQT